jgi:hypothetical protein
MENLNTYVSMFQPSDELDIEEHLLDDLELARAGKKVYEGRYVPGSDIVSVGLGYLQTPEELKTLPEINRHGYGCVLAESVQEAKAYFRDEIPYWKEEHIKNKAYMEEISRKAKEYQESMKTRMKYPGNATFSS